MKKTEDKMKTMKKRMSRIFGLLIIGAALMTGVSCSNDIEGLIEQPGVTEEVEHTAVMHLTGGLQSYTQKRETSTVWNEGDIIYLRFYRADEKTVVCGKAVYNATSSVWNISYYGNLDTGSTLKCEVFYFVDATATDNYNVTMTPMSCAYVDNNGTYIVDSGELYVSAVLAPKTARMHVKGETDKTVLISGVVYNTSFNLKDNVFTTSENEISTQFESDGYTPYIYCSLGESNEITLGDIYYKYTKSFDPEKFAAGESGYMIMPSQVENKGWESTLYYPKNAVDMGLSVRWSSMNVGASDQYDDGIFTSWGDANGMNTSTSNSYNGNLHEIAGNPTYDIATNLWNERWQIPTQEQWQELRDKCNWVYAYDSEKKVYGYTVTADNGNSIYLPMYNYVTGTSVPSGISDANNGCYWSATEYSGNNYSAYFLGLGSGSQNVNSTKYKYYRMLIRPVLIK